MFNEKPTTSLIEDLETLGLLSEGETLSKRAKKQLAENAGGMEPEGAHAEPDGDEAPVGLAAPPAPPMGAGPPAPPAPKTPPMPSKLAPPKSDDGMGSSMGGSMDAAGAVPPSAADDMSNDDDEVAAYESAWDCVKQYYALNERNEKLSEDDYKTVVNAMAFIIETQGKYMGPEQLEKDPQTLPGGEGKWTGDASHDPIDKVDGVGAMKKVKGFKYHLASPKPGEKAESLDALVSELKTLTQKDESNVDMQDLGNKIIEGFEAIRDASQRAAKDIATELKESNERVTESHPRLKLGKFFEGVSGDAKLLLKAISERDTTDVDDAIEDLNSLARDFKRGLAQL
jgi:hypothetical protein